MQILGLMGGARKGGNTDILLDVALDEARNKGASTIKIALADKKIADCNGCLKCHETGECVFKDDMVEIYREMLAAQGIIWATPIYFWSMTGQTKTVMDRCYALLFPKLRLASKVAGLIMTAGGRGCMNTANVFHMYFNYNHMFFAEFASGYAPDKGAIKQNSMALNSTKEMVHQMISLIRANLKYPEEFDAPLPRFVKRKYGL